MHRFGLALAGALIVLALVVPALGAGSQDDRKILEFQVLAGVSAPYTGATNPIRGIAGGGLPWEIDSASGELRSDGRLEVEVEGLVLARRAPVPPQLQGTNPISVFRAIVSCQTVDATGAPAVVNVPAGSAPATTTGDAQIEATADLPTPCYAPIVFVTSPGGAWFAVTGH
jgi:hypothetical protein